MVTQNQPPYGCNIFQLNLAACDLVEKCTEYALEKWRVYKESREWPGYEPRIACVSTPSWIEYAFESLISGGQIENDAKFFEYSKVLKFLMFLEADERSVATWL